MKKNDIKLVIYSMSLFGNLYKFKASSLKGPQEDFLTEILAYSLKNNSEFLKTFLKVIGIADISINHLYVSTQTKYSGSRPDIEIQINNEVSILIESKFGSGLGLNQLKKYRLILDQKNEPIKRLVFLTKNYHEYNQSLEVNYLRWYQMINWLKLSNNNAITNEFINYLKELGMEQELEFSLQDYQTLANSGNMISKMKELVLRVVSKFEKEIKVIGGVTPEIALRESWYGYSVQMAYGKISYGFRSDLNETIPSAFIEIWSNNGPLSNLNKLSSFIKTKNQKWELRDEVLIFLKNLGSTDNKQISQFDEIELFFRSGIDDLKLMKDEFPDLLS